MPVCGPWTMLAVVDTWKRFFINFTSISKASLTSSISHWWTSSTSGCLMISLTAPPSPPPTSRTWNIKFNSHVFTAWTMFFYWPSLDRGVSRVGHVPLSHDNQTPHALWAELFHQEQALCHRSCCFVCENQSNHIEGWLRRTDLLKTIMSWYLDFSVCRISSICREKLWPGQTEVISENHPLFRWSIFYLTCTVASSQINC